MEPSYFLVIDGSSLLSTNYYGTLPPAMKFAKTEDEKKAVYNQLMHTSTGLYTNGLMPSIRMILDIVRLYPEITHMAVVFDKTRDTFRRKIYADYKAQRKETPAPLKEQFINLEQALRDIGLVSLYSDDFEADDLAGSIIKHFKSNEHHMIFMTRDHDYLQLVGHNVSGWMVQSSQDRADAIMTRRGVDLSEIEVPGKIAIFDTKTVVQEEGVYPLQIPDKKGICGDISDNIPGVKGVGDSAVIPLLKHYGSIEEIYKAIHENGTSPKDIKKLNVFWKEQLGISRSPIKKLIAEEDTALLSKKLATICCDVPIDMNIDNYKININANGLLSVIEKYELNSLRSLYDYFA